MVLWRGMGMGRDKGMDMGMGSKRVLRGGVRGLVGRLEGVVVVVVVE